MGARMYREHLAAGGVIGIPKGSLLAANLLTDAGVQGSARRFQRRQQFDEGRAAYAVNMSLAQSAGRPLKLRNNPYSRALAQRYYGMGDDSWDESAGRTDLAPQSTYTPTSQVLTDSGWANVAPTYVAPTPPIAPPSAGGSSSNWANVLNSSSVANLFAGVGSGLNNLISGRKVPVVSSILPTSGAPSLTTMLLVGGGAVGAAYFLFRRKR